MKLKEAIISYIKKENIPVSTLEKKANLNRNAISNILYGRSKNPKIENIQAIAKAMNCSIESLLAGDDKTLTDVYLEEFEIGDFELFKKIVLAVLKKIKDKKTVEGSKVLLLIKEVYEYCLDKEDIDPTNIVEWMIDKNFKQS